MDAVESARFFALALRLPAYRGAITATIEREREDAKAHSPAPALRNGTATEADDSALSEFIITPETS